MADIFISYSKKDNDILQNIAATLIKLGHSPVYDENVLRGGENFEEALDRAMDKADGFLFIFSDNSVNSTYMAREFGIAEKSGKFIIPVVSGNPTLPPFIGSKHYFDLEDPQLSEKISSLVRPGSVAPVSSSVPPDSRVKRTAKQIEKKVPPDASYWFLKLNPDTWNILEFPKYFNEDMESLFGVHNLNNQKRVEFDEYFKVKKGDRIIGYAFSEKRAIECVFEVIKGVHTRKEAGDVISMKFVKLVSPPIPLGFFINELPFRDKLEAEHPERLFAITKEIYDKLLDADKSSYSTRDAYLSNYTTEGDHDKTDDQLSFTADIASFGTVICLKKVRPPLAIGLFGKWGSGKSFFMEKLSDFIDELALKEDDRYVRNVVQVKFNSWHYSDANLWASLITEIFDSLNDFATKKGKISEIEKLSATLQLTNMHKEEAEQRKKELTAKISTLRSDQEAKRKRLEDISGLNLLKMAFLDPKIKADITLLNNGGLESIEENREKLEGYFRDVKSFGSRINIFINQLLSLKGRRWWWLIGMATLVFFASYFIKHFYAGAWAQFSLLVSVKWAIIVSAAGKLSEAVLSYQGLFNKINERWTSLKKTIDERPQVTDERLTLHERELVQVTSELTEIDQKLQQTQKEINDISSGKKLLEFIDSKSRDEAYSRQLGLIAWIRKDFQTLDKLLREQHLASAERKDKAPIDNPQNVRLKIDRIVLYIDDLDRCDADIVEKVLKAIHLLLAFPLFVVVVGVDPRWLNNALNEKYGKLFSPKSGVNSESAITSYDYLEKIFQIPFALKEASDTDRHRLLDYLMREELEKQQAAPGHNPPIDINESGGEDKNKDGVGVAETEQTEDQAQQIVAKQVLDRVDFKGEEIAYMKRISAMFGQTPRMMNRYVNIYRIIKSHRNYQVGTIPTARDFKPTMFVLGVIVGFPQHAKYFVDELTKTRVESMIGFIMTLENKDLFDFIDKNSTKNDVDDLTTTIVKRNLELISRFSFRTYDSQDAFIKSEQRGLPPETVITP